MVDYVMFREHKLNDAESSPVSTLYGHKQGWEGHLKNFFHYSYKLLHTKM